MPAAQPLEKPHGSRGSNLGDGRTTGPAKRRRGFPAGYRSQGTRMIRIANGQGFWGDSLEAPVEQVRRGPIEYLTLDYLAEITMSILQKERSRDRKTGYARD